MFTWLNDVYSLVAEGNSDAAVDVLFDNVESLLSAGDFSKCCALLKAIDLDRMNDELLISAIAIVSPAARLIAGYDSFVDRVNARLPSHLKT